MCQNLLILHQVGGLYNRTEAYCNWGSKEWRERREKGSWHPYDAFQLVGYKWIVGIVHSE